MAKARRDQPEGKRRHGLGSIEWVRKGAEGYLWVRGRLMYRGERHTTDGIGFGREITKAEQEWAEAEIDSRLEVLYTDLTAGRTPDRAREQRPLRKQLELWLEAGKARWLPHTYSEFARSITQHVKGYPIARLQLGELQPEDVDAWLTAVRKSGASTYQVRYAYDRLLECLKALKADRFRGEGVAAIIDTSRSRRPRHRKTSTRPFDEAELELLVGHLIARQAAEHPWPALFGVDLLAGLRFAEGAGLWWQDVHGLDVFGRWASGARRGNPPLVTLTIRQQLDRHTRTPRELKSEAAERTIPLVPAAAELLLAHRTRERAEGRACVGEAFVFVARSRDGRMREVGYSSARRHLSALCDGAGLGPTGKTHALRHSFGTAAGAAGVPRHLLKGMMGHADEATTSIYTGFVAADAERETRRLGKRLPGGKNVRKAASES